MRARAAGWTAALITTAPHELVAPIHDRIPAIFRPQGYDEMRERARPGRRRAIGGSGLMGGFD
jgi:putative SOS response-associated peptidase YedK